MGDRDISIIIVNWNTCDDLRKCLRSVGESSSVRAETILVDNASSDGSVEMVRSEFPWVNIIHNQANLGFAKASNQGIGMSDGRYVMLLNPDCVVHPGSLSALVEFGDSNSDIGIFGPKILNPNGTLQFSCRRFPTLQAGIFRNSILGRIFPKNPYTRDYLMIGWDHSEPRDVDWVSGAALFIRRKMLDQIGLLDERFFMYCEDVDIAYRAKQEGWRVSYFPGATVIHAIGRSSDHNPNGMIIEFHKSMYRFFKKHYVKDWFFLVRWIVPAGLFARAAFFISRNAFNYTRSRLFHRRRAA